MAARELHLGVNVLSDGMHPAAWQYPGADPNWFTDPALVNRLAAEKLDSSAGAVRGEGWKWLEIIPELSWEALKGFGKATLDRSPPTDAQALHTDR